MNVQLYLYLCLYKSVQYVYHVQTHKHTHILLARECLVKVVLSRALEAHPPVLMGIIKPLPASPI